MSEKIYGIDMGTNSIKIYQKAAGVILHQKNMIAMVKKISYQSPTLHI